MNLRLGIASRLWLWLGAACACSAQSIVDPSALGPAVRLFERQAGDRPLECTVTPIKPTLNFSFRFQAGYVVRVPMRQYFGPGHRWLMAVRVTPEGGGRKPVYFAGRITLPDIPRNNAEVELGGGYLLGVGRYRVEWMMYDDGGRVCRKQWRLDAKLRGSERLAKVATPPYTIQAFSLRGSPAESRTRDDHAPFRVTILMDAAPLVPWRTRLRASDQVLLIGSLSAMLERLPTRSVRLVVFNLDQQKELYCRDGFTPGRIDDVAQAISGLELNVVNYHVLQNPKGHLDLLSSLVNRELDSAAPSEAVIFLGPATRFLDKPPPGAWDRVGGARPLFFDFQYKPAFRRSAPTFPDTISLAVSALQGRTFTIYTPGDFAKAIAQLEHRLATP
jgi:hypothetical protein